MKDPQPEPDHEFSSVQVQITGRVAEIIHKLATAIPDRDLASDGRENESHITVKWGLKFQSPSKRLRDAVRDFGPIEATLKKSSLFQNDDADVLKVDVDSPDLHRLNRLISRVVPTHDTHPTYIPHATLAYLRKGTGKKYAGSTALVGQKLRFDSLTFSGKKGHRETLPLGQAAPAPYRVR
jgi:2'-5' RNA ligase